MVSPRKRCGTETGSCPASANNAPSTASACSSASYCSPMRGRFNISACLIRRPRQHLPDFLDQIAPCDGDLCRLCRPFLMRLDLGGKTRPESQILQRHLARGIFVCALDDCNGRAPPVGIAELPPHIAAAKKHLGPDTRLPEFGTDGLVITHAFAIDGEDHVRAYGLGSLALCPRRERSQQPIPADRDARGPYALSAEALK